MFFDLFQSLIVFLLLKSLVSYPGLWAFEQDPCQTLKTASVGWPRLRYLCIANCNMDGEWKIKELTGLPQIIAKNCPKLQEFAVYDDNMRTGG